MKAQVNNAARDVTNPNSGIFGVPVGSPDITAEVAVGIPVGITVDVPVPAGSITIFSFITFHMLALLPSAPKAQKPAPLMFSEFTISSFRPRDSSSSYQV